MKTLHTVFFFFLYSLFSPSSYAFFDPLPDPKTSQFSLLTVGLGSGVENRYGHTMLSVTDTRTGERRLLNWGTYDFNAPNYILNFLKGFLRYSVSENSYAPTLRYYRDYEKRSIVEDQIVLSDAQKAKFLKILEERLKPENAFFWYDFFYENCSTIPRDILNEVLYGRIAEATHKLPATMNLRAYVRRDLSEWAVIGFFLDIMLNREVDKPIDAWVEMFVPLMLEKYLEDMPQYDDNGNPIPGTRLLMDRRELVSGGIYPSSNLNFFHISLISGLILIFLTLLLLRLGSRWANRLLAGSCMVWGLFSGLMGTVLLVGWTYTNHIVLSHNANLWVFWPFDFAFIALGLAILREKKLSRLWKPYLLLHLVAAAAFLGLFLSDALEQDVSNIAYFLVPLASLLYALIFYVIRTNQSNSALR